MTQEKVETLRGYGETRLEQEHRHYVKVIIASIILSLLAMLGDVRDGPATAAVLLGIPYFLSLFDFEVHFHIPESGIIEEQILKRRVHI